MVGCFHLCCNQLSNLPAASGTGAGVTGGRAFSGSSIYFERNSVRHHSLPSGFPSDGSLLTLMSIVLS